MPATTDFYKVLGVDDDASQKEIKSAYRKLARESHPDRNPDDKSAEERFKAVQEAYENVGDEAKRKAYDSARNDPYGGRFEGQPFDGFASPGGQGGRFYRTPDGTYVRVDASGGGPQSDFVFGGGGGLGDLFERQFGGFAGMGGGGAQPRGGRDVEASLRLSFEEALEGGKREFRTPNGKDVRITVPQGVRSGLKIKMRGHGEPSPTGRGETGDLLLTFQVTPSPQFKRDGDDLTVTETISAVEAMLGTTRKVTNAYGQSVRVTIAAGTQPGATLRLRNQGVRTDKGTGDMLVELVVVVPTLSDDAKTSLGEWAQANELSSEK